MWMDGGLRSAINDCVPRDSVSSDKKSIRVCMVLLLAVLSLLAFGCVGTVPNVGIGCALFGALREGDGALGSFGSIPWRRRLWRWPPS